MGAGGEGARARTRLAEVVSPALDIHFLVLESNRNGDVEGSVVTGQVRAAGPEARGCDGLGWADVRGYGSQRGGGQKSFDPRRPLCSVFRGAGRDPAVLHGCDPADPHSHTSFPVCNPH